jgi:hypothetical protein
MIDQLYMANWEKPIQAIACLFETKQTCLPINTLFQQNQSQCRQAVVEQFVPYLLLPNTHRLLAIAQKVFSLLYNY